MNCFSKIQEQIKPEGEIPCPRYNASMCANLDQTQIYIYGGRDQTGKCFNDFYMYDIIRNNMKKIQLVCYNQAMQAPSIHSHQLVPVTQNEYMIIGGMKQSGVLETNDYVINFINGIYQIQQVRTNKMHAPVVGHTVTKLGDVLYLIGGLTEGKAFNNYIYYFEISRRKWEITSIQRQLPNGRYYHQSTAIDNDKIIISGGQFGEKPTQYYDQMWLFNPTYRSFLRIDHRGKFEARSGFTQIFWKSATGNLRLVVSGGYTKNGIVFDGIQMLLDSRLGDQTPGVIKSTIDQTMIKSTQQSVTFKEEQDEAQDLALSSFQQQQEQQLQKTNQQIKSDYQPVVKSILKNQYENVQDDKLSKRIEFLEFELANILEQNKIKQQEVNSDKLQQQINDINEKLNQQKNGMEQNVQFPHLAFAEFKQEILGQVFKKINDDICDAQANTEQKLRQYLGKKIEDQNSKIDQNTSNINILDEKQQNYDQFVTQNFVKVSQFQVIQPAMQQLEREQKQAQSSIQFIKEKLLEIEARTNLDQIQLKECEIEGNLREGIRQIAEQVNEKLTKRYEKVNNQLVNVQRQYNDLQEELKVGNVNVKIHYDETQQQQLQSQMDEKIKQAQNSVLNQFSQFKLDLDKQLSNIQNNQSTAQIQVLTDEVNQLRIQCNELLRTQRDFNGIKEKFDTVLKQMNNIQNENKLLKSQIDHYRTMDVEKCEEIEQLKEELKQTQQQNGSDEQKSTVQFEKVPQQEDYQQGLKLLEQSVKTNKDNDLTHSDLELIKTIINEDQEQNNEEQNEQEEQQPQEQVEEQINSNIQKQTVQFADQQEQKQQEEQQQEEKKDQQEEVIDQEVNQQNADNDQNNLDIIQEQQEKQDEQQPIQEQQKDNNEQDKQVVEEQPQQQIQQSQQQVQIQQQPAQQQIITSLTNLVSFSTISTQSQQVHVEQTQEISQSVNKTLQPPKVSIVSEPQVEHQIQIQKSAVIEQKQAIQNSQPQSILKKSVNEEQKQTTEDQLEKSHQSQKLLFEKPKTFSPVDIQLSKPVIEQKPKDKIIITPQYKRQVQLIDEKPTIQDTLVLYYDEEDETVLCGDELNLVLYNVSKIDKNLEYEIQNIVYNEDQSHILKCLMKNNVVIYSSSNQMVRIVNDYDPSQSREFNPFGYDIVSLKTYENNGSYDIICSTKEGFICIWSQQQNDFKIINDQQVESQLIQQEVYQNMLISIFQNGTILLCDLDQQKVTKKIQIQQLRYIQAAAIYNNIIYLVSNNEIFISDLEGQIQYFIKQDEFSEQSQLTKEISNIYTDGDFIYLTRDNLIEIYDLNKTYIKTIYNKQKVQNICLGTNKIFVQTSHGQVICNLN